MSAEVPFIFGAAAEVAWKAGQVEFSLESVLLEHALSDLYAVAFDALMRASANTDERGQALCKAAEHALLQVLSHHNFDPDQEAPS